SMLSASWDFRSYKDRALGPVNQLSTGDGAIYNDNRQRKHSQDMDDDEKKTGTEGATISAKKCKTKSEKRTRSGRVIVLNYHGLLIDIDVGTSSEKTTYTNEDSSQENEEEATTENSFENRSQGNDKKRTIQDNIITDILGNTELSNASKKIFMIYKAQYPDKLSRQVATSYLIEMDTMIEMLVLANNSQIDDLRAPEKGDFIMNSVVRVLRHTLSQFIKAFSLEEQNPLLNIGTLEHIASKNHTNGNRANGVGYMMDADKYQLIYVEGSRPKTIKSRQRLPKKLLNEIDNANLPRKFSEMKNFVYFYESVLKWSLLVHDVKASFDDARAEQRPS
ncbi:8816_t:CDS:10, partial [Scutellospora calospora]